MLEARCVDGKSRKKRLSDGADKVPTSWRVGVWKASTVELFLSSSLNFCDYHGTLATIGGVGSDLDVSSSVLEAILQSDQGEAVITHGPDLSRSREAAAVISIASKCRTRCHAGGSPDGYSANSGGE